MDLMKLMVRIGADTSEAEKGISRVSKLGNTLSKGLKTAAKGATIAIGAAATAVGFLTKSAVQAYSQYEQLVGGVETLFGAGGKSLEEYAESVGKSTTAVRREYNVLVKSQNTVLQNSKKAYKTAGMSANEYMETVTSFSASLIQSLGGDTAKAATLADKAIIDMSDNANKMGTDIENIKNAYAGFAKGNFTMLDNLKLGYGGTKEEMERLLKEAEKISGIKYDVSSYADIVEAIHVVQNEMGITGTTAKEADTTIQGSLAATKAAWTNVLTAIAGGNIDLQDSIDALVESGIKTLNNIWPVVSQVLSGIAEMVKQVAPVVAENLPGLISEILPKLLDAASTLVGGLISALPGLIEELRIEIGVLLGNIQMYLNKNGLGWLGNFVSGIESLLNVIIALLNGDVTEAFYSFTNFISSTVAGVLELLGVNAKDARDIGNNIRDWIRNTIEAIVGYWTDTLKPAWDEMMAVVRDKVVPVISKAWTGLRSIVKTVFNALGNFWAKTLFPIYGKMLAWIADDLIPAIQTAWEDLQPKIEAVFNAIKGFWENTLQPALRAMWTWTTENLIPAIRKAWQDLQPKVEAVFNAIKGFWENTLEPTFEAIRAFVVDTVVPLIVEAWNTVSPAVKAVFEAISTWWTEHGEGIINGIAETIGTVIETIKGWFNGLIEFITGVFSGDWKAAWEGIKNAFGAVFSGLWKLLKDPINGVIKGLNFMIDKVESAINGVIKSINKHLKIEIPAIEVFGKTVWEGATFGPQLKTVNWGRLKYLAKGGILGEGQRALVGEFAPEYLTVRNGRAVVTPIKGAERFGGNTITNNFNIYQREGENMEQLAQRINDILVRQERQRRVALA